MGDLEPPEGNSCQPEPFAVRNSEPSSFMSGSLYAPLLTTSQTARRLLLCGSGFLFVGLIIGARILASSVIPHIVKPGDYLDFQEATDGQPIPRLLNWSMSFIHLLLALNESNPGLLVLFGLILLILLGTVTMTAINPTFKLLLFTHAASETTFGVLPGRQEVKQSDPLLENSLAGLTVAEAEALTEISEEEADALTAPLSNSSDRDLLSHLALQANIPHIEKALRCLIPVTLPVLIVWLLTQRLIPTLPTFLSSALLYITLGISLFLAFHTDGLAGNFDNSERKVNSMALKGMIFRGTLFGIVLTLLVRGLFPLSLPDLLTKFQMLGSYHRGYWDIISPRYLTATACVWFAAGCSLYLLAQINLQALQNLGFALFPLGATGIAFLAQAPLFPSNLAQRLDITPTSEKAVAVPYTPKRPDGGTPNGTPAADALAVRLNLKMGSQPGLPDRDLLLFFPRGMQIVRQVAITEDGLSADPSTEGAVRSFLKDRRYQTAYSWPAMKHLFYTGIVNFEPGKALSALLLDLENCPHLSQFGGTGRSMFYTIAASPENLQLLNRYADPARFAFPDRNSQRMLGYLYLRFGEREKAMQWFRKAEMPVSFMERVSAEPLPLHTGKVTGTLLLNGKPLAGIKVAMLPQNLQNVPRDLALLIPQANREIVPKEGTGEYYPAFHPRPWGFRHMSTGGETDANGHFSLEFLTEGTYMLVCALPSDIRLQLPEDSSISVENQPGRIEISAQQPVQDAGIIAIKIADTKNAANTPKP